VEGENKCKEKGKRVNNVGRRGVHQMHLGKKRYLRELNTKRKS